MSQDSYFQISDHLRPSLALNVYAPLVFWLHRMLFYLIIFGLGPLESIKHDFVLFCYFFFHQLFSSVNNEVDT